MRILTGPTASGKAAVALCLAESLNAEIISVDSMKVYRGLDVGTAKPSAAVRDAARFHMMDIVAPSESFSLARYLTGALSAWREIRSRGREALFVGGTPLYLRGLLYGIFEGPAADWELRARLKDEAERLGAAALHERLRKADPVTAGRLHPNDLTRVIRALEVVEKTGAPLAAHQRQFPAARPAVAYRLVALRRDDADLKERIARRTERMFAAGLVDEVRQAAESGLNRSAQKAIGYREVIAHLAGGPALPETMELVRRNTWRLARKQRGWIKSFPDATWLDVAADEPPEQTAARARRLLYGPPDMN